MEFLMTYGWAILVVLAAIAALAYFGVLSPDRFVPDKCVVQGGGLSCEEFNAVDDTITVVLSNNGGKDLTAVTVTFTPKAGCGTADITPAAQDVDDGARATYAFTCPATISGKARGDLSIDFVPADGTLTQRATGNLAVKAQ
jgi:hypothetical protein